MINAQLVFIVCIALASSIFTGINALFRSQISERNYFLLMQVMISIYLIGHIQKITSSNAEEAFAAVKVMYIGLCFAIPFVLFFTADYFTIKLHPVFIKLPILIQSLAMVIAMWTTKTHRLVYTSYAYSETMSERLIFAPGQLYSAIYIFSFLYLTATFAMLLYHIKKWKKKYRTKLILLFVSLLAPTVSTVVYFISTSSGNNSHYFNVTPHALIITNICLHLVIMRYNIFEIITIATVSAIEHVKEGFVVLDEHDNYLSSNPAAKTMFPTLKKTRRGESIFSLDVWPRELTDTENSPGEFSVQIGCSKHFRASISPVLDKDNSPLAKIILFSDITDTVTLLKELENAACRDSLTGLYNRRHFDELADTSIKRAWRAKQASYMGMLDLDFFKNINDTYGHSAGDIVLKTTADILVSSMRSYDLAARYGGEEFVFLITDIAHPSEARKLLERIRSSIERYVVTYEDLEIKITCSIGAAVLLKTDTLESAIKKADIALYEAKNAGRNCVKMCPHFNGNETILSGTIVH